LIIRYVAGCWSGPDVACLIADSRAGIGKAFRVVVGAKLNSTKHTGHVDATDDAM
jgi:hypothetical protein